MGRNGPGGAEGAPRSRATGWKSPSNRWSRWLPIAGAAAVAPQVVSGLSVVRGALVPVTLERVGGRVFVGGDPVPVAPEPVGRLAVVHGAGDPAPGRLIWWAGGAGGGGQEVVRGGPGVGGD